MILILDDPQDAHTRCIRSELRKIGAKCAVLDTRDFGRGSRLGVDDQGAGWLACSLSGEQFSLSEIKTVWLRRPGRFDLRGIVSDPYVEFATREWRDLFWGWLDSIEARFVNPLAEQERATKIQQLQAARQVGLAVPDTLVSNQRSAISAFVEKHGGEVIHKSLTQHRNLPMFTKAWNEDADSSLQEVDLCPILVQERIIGQGDIRVTMIGEKGFAAFLATPPDEVDSRLVPDIPYEAWQLPSTLEEKLHALMARLGLCFGTIDLKLANDSTPYFLEVNPQGQFAYIEIATGMELIHEMACFLAEAA